VTLFCRYAGAQLDNNDMEAILKLVIRGRKNAMFYKTLAGAAIADTIMSLIATSQRAGINTFDYLVVLQQQAQAVKRQPEQWLPWNYQDALQRLDLAA
jgi:transposase